MVTPEQYRETERDIAIVDDIRTRINGKGTLSELLALTAPLEEIYQRRCAAHGWRVVEDLQVMLSKLSALQRAVDEGTLTETAHMMSLVRLGIFTGYRQHIQEALEEVKAFLLQS